MVMVEMENAEPSHRPSITRAVSYPARTLTKAKRAQVAGMIANAVNYHHDGTAACFDPGLCIRVHEKQRTVTLEICLSCSKMSVSTVPGKMFTIDFSPAGELAYKALYVDLMVLKQGLERE